MSGTPSSAGAPTRSDLTVPSSGRDDRIDSLRGLAIALVIILHATMLTPDPTRLGWIFPVVARFSVGMQLFFVISGYLVIQSWRRVSTGSRPVTVFLIKRAAKIYPLYLVFLTLNIALWLWFTAEANQAALPIRNFLSHANFNAGNVAAHLVFLQGFIPAYIHSLLDGSWSIANEVYFYLLVPCVMAPFARTLRSTLGLYFSTLAVAVLLNSTWSSITAWAPLSFLQSGSEGFSYYFFLNHLPFFVVGMALTHVIGKPAVVAFCSESRHPLWAGALVLALGMINGTVWPLGYHHLYTSVILAGILALFGWPSTGTQMIRRTFAYLGRQSYALFFLHLFLIKAFMAIWALQVWGTENVWFVVAANLLVGFAGSLLLSELIFDRLDRWCVRLGNRFAGFVAQKADDPA